MRRKARRRKVLLVGESPPTEEHLQDYDPLYGKCTRWLAKMADVDHVWLLERTVRRNLHDEVVGRWSRPAARDAMDDVMQWASQRPELIESVVLLGRKVQEAWDYEDGRLPILGYVGTTWTGHELYCCPHPSGLCRWWNAAVNRRCARVVLREVLRP